MGCFKFCLIGTLLVAALLGYKYHTLTRIPEFPKIDVDKWWGPGEPKEVDTSIRPFKVQFTDEMIADLKDRLSKTKLTPPLEGVAFEYGFNNDYLKEVIQFWSKDYKFKEREAYFNKYPQFKTNIQGLDVHYVHVKPKVSKDIEILPLLLTSGFPGSFREWYGIIDFLTAPRKDKNFVFEVILASPPGFDFSQAPAKTGFSANEVAVVLRNLMKRLGFSKYYLQGGNWAAIFMQNIAVLFPKEVLGIHLSAAAITTDLASLKWILGSIYPPFVVDDKYRDWMYPFTDKIFFILQETGYMHMHSTKPDTLGVSLLNSPAGIAAYVMEKYSTWTNADYMKLPDGGLTEKYTLTDLLDNVMVYWVSNCINTKMRLYSETFNKHYQALKMDNFPIYAPAAIYNTKHDPLYQSEYILQDKLRNIVQVTHSDECGAFEAFCGPRALTDDIWAAFAKIRKFNETFEKQEL